MAEKKTPMGADPLAWLTEEEEQTKPSSKPVSKSTTRRRRVKKSTKTEAEFLEETFAVIAPHGDQMADRFYTRLFEEYPQLTPLFEGISIKGQQKKLLASLVLLVQNLHKPEVLNDYLKGLGARHEHYGVIAKHYPLFAENLLSVLEEFSGDIWTTDVEQAWANTINTVALIMQEAYVEEEEEEIATTKQEENHSLDILLSAIDGAITAVMMCDKDLVITYVNPAVIALLANRLKELRKVFPALDLNNLVGTCIDDFHKDPSLQRRVLADLDNLPYNNQFQLLDIYFDLTATAILNADGEYVGNMVEWRDITDQRRQELESANTIAAYDGQLKAINKVMGVISFEMDGTIIDINDNFLTMMGYSKEEVIGKHHQIFAADGEAESAEYAEFWAKLNRGKYDSGEYKRVGNNGKEVWLQASYNPIFDVNGKAYRVVKYATEVTAEKLKNADTSGQLDAIGKAMGIVSFDMDGMIIDINDNFLKIIGYNKEEVIGKHHRIFAGADMAASPEYAAFWAKLNQGKYDSGEYTRLNKKGEEVHLQASYNPIFDLNGKPFKVVKYAVDITANKKLQQSVQKVMIETATVMNAVSTGDLTQKLEGNNDSELTLLQSSINDTIAKIATTMTDINESASNVSTAASEISEGNIDLSQRTEEQAASLEQTAASMEEFTVTIRQNADSAIQAKELAEVSREQAEKGGGVIKEAITAMAEISASSKKVSDIISVIDEIAFQTNLLALNAAVEAARAGEQGRGFAVVASEVRNLAQRSASAAKEIKILIKDSGEKVKEGSMLVDESGRTLEEIVTGSQTVSNIITEIAAAGTEQTKGIEQVNQAVTHMDEMTQQNAALVEQAAAASEALSEQAQNMQRLVGFFKVEKSLIKPRLTPPLTSVKEEVKDQAHLKSSPYISEDDEWDEF